jgi:hypothetical protein
MEGDMRSAASHGADRNMDGKRRLRQAGAMAGLLTAVALVAGACAGSDHPGKTVASVAAEAGSTSAATPAATGMGDPLAFAKCMRENGLPDFADPKPGVGISADVVNSPQFKAAESHCKQFMGALQGGPDGAVTPKDQWSSADKLKYAQCMRQNGVPKFPDPDANGGFIFLEGGGIDPRSPQFKKAEAACAKYQPQNIRKMTPNKQVAPGGGS